MISGMSWEYRGVEGGEVLEIMDPWDVPVIGTDN